MEGSRQSRTCLTRRSLFPIGIGGLLTASGCASGTGGSKSAPSAAVSEKAVAVIVPNDPPVAPLPAGATVYDAIEVATQHFTTKCARLWGTQNVVLPSQKAWVSYDDDWTSRGDVDFEHGEFVAQALVDADRTSETSAALARIRQRLADAQTDTPTDMADDDDITKLANQLTGTTKPPAAPIEAKGPPVLAGILPPDAATRLSPAAVEQTPVTGEDGKARIMLTYRVPFRDGYFLKLASRYTDAVQQEALQCGLQPSLLLAVMETESAFNPRARSPVPAYGLMQLVPRTAASDAYAFLYGGARVLDPEYLYDASNNIRLGAAYLKVLDSRYLHAVSDPRSRGYAIIAAYNTGAGNVARAFNGTTNINSAAQIINVTAPNDVLKRLQAQLPYEETRTYVTAVVARQERYKSFDRPQATAAAAPS